MAATEEVEGEDSNEFHQTHMGEIFGRGFSFSGYERDLVKWNAGDGTYVDVSGVSGADSISDGRGTVYADFDNDGDLDIFLTAMQRKAHYLFNNNVGDPANFLRIELIGTASGTDAYGTTVTIKYGDQIQRLFKAGGSGYISQSDDRLLFGLGDTTQVDEVIVKWPSGNQEVFGSTQTNRSYKLIEGSKQLIPVEPPTFTFPEPWNTAEQLLSQAGLQIGDAFPNLQLLTLDGGAINSSEIVQPNRKSLINLWTTWCTSCAKEMPELNHSRSRFTKAGIDLIGISLDLETQDSVVPYLENMGIEYPVYLIQESGMELLFPSGEVHVPLTFLVSEDGIIEGMWAGWNATVQDDLNQLMAP